MSPTGRKKKRNRFGYTLIELILTALIIAILVGISMPIFQRQFSDLELRNSCYNIAKLVGFAQEKAVGEGKFFRINFDFEEDRYWLTAGEDLKEFKRFKDKYGRIYSLPAGVTASGKKGSFIFYPNGSSEKIDIILTGKSTSYSIKSRGRLGHVEVEKLDGG